MMLNNKRVSLYNFSVPDYNHKITLLGGQAFNWDLVYEDFNESKYFGFTNKHLFWLTWKSNKFIVKVYPSVSKSYVRRYLGLNTDMKDVHRVLSMDDNVRQAINKYKTIYILNQDFEQTLLSFILSANNNIKSIRRSIRLMTADLGKKAKIQGRLYQFFPSTAAIASTSIDKLRSYKIGFRAKYLKATAKILTDTNYKQELFKMVRLKKKNEIFRMLQDLPGVGPKIADCVMVFSLDFTYTTPMDVWSKRYLHDLYGVPLNSKYDYYREWITKKWGKYAAYAGQYLFEWWRSRK